MNTSAANDKMILKLETGNVEIELYPDVAPAHVKRIKALAKNKEYDGVVFHRVISGFMAQTGDVQFGNSKKFNSKLVGTGGSSLPDLKISFGILYDRMAVVMLLVVSLISLLVHIFSLEYME